MLAILIAIAALAPGPAAVPNRDQCGDDRGVDRCDAAEQARMRDRYGISPIESETTRLTWVRRAMFVDGYGRDQGLIIFADRPGQEPTVEFRAVGADGKRRAISAPISRPALRELLTKTQLFHRALAKEAEDQRFICLHSSVVTIEGVRPVAARANEVEPKFESRTQKACGESPTWQAARVMREAALQAFPWCASLSGKYPFRTEVDQLATCARFSGDRYSAAEAFMAFGEVSRPSTADWSHVAHWEWNSTTLRHGIKRDDLPALLKDTYLFMDSIAGVNADRAIVRGVANRTVKPEGGTSREERAPFTMEWLRARPGEEGEFRLNSLDLGKFEPLAPPPPR